MAATKITSKGQVTIPREVRRRLGVGPGDRIEFKEVDNKFVIEKQIQHSPFDKYLGYLKNKQGQDSEAVIEKLRGG